MKQSLKDKVVVITGASSGIGLAAAKAFAAEGSKLAVAARNIEKLNKLKEELSQNDIICIKTDVTIEGECQNLIEQTIAKYGRIDILINNAGISMRAMFKDLDLSICCPGINPFGHRINSYAANINANVHPADHAPSDIVGIYFPSFTGDQIVAFRQIINEG